MSAHFEKSAKLNGMIKKAAVYPIIVVIVAIAVVIVMLVKVIPSYSEMFNDLGTELPGITKAVVAMRFCYRILVYCDCCHSSNCYSHQAL